MNDLQKRCLVVLVNHLSGAKPGEEKLRMMKVAQAVRQPLVVATRSGWKPMKEIPKAERKAVVAERQEKMKSVPDFNALREAILQLEKDGLVAIDRITDQPKGSKKNGNFVIATDKGINAYADAASAKN